MQRSPSPLRLTACSLTLAILPFTSSVPAIDLDGNGISDVWQALGKDGAPPTAVADSPDGDGDGLSDWEEVQLGFNPAAPASVRAMADGGDAAQFSALFAQDSKSISAENASRFLLQATLGPTQNEIERVQKLGFDRWLDIELTRKATLTEPYIEYLASRNAADIKEPTYKFAYHKIQSSGNNLGYRNTATAWMRSVLGGNDHLRQRVAWALSQILVVSSNDSNILTEGMCHYYDRLLEGAFGNYEDLLLEVTLHPMMGKYLSHLGNRKANPAINRFPDENYAREIMQLFSIGLWELNPDGSMKLDAMGEPIPTYSNEDIQTLARVFTGLWIGGMDFGKNDWANYDQPMAMFADRHDQGEKIALGGRLHLPADNPPMKDIEDTVKALALHPTTAPFITTRLINHLVTSNPSPDYIERVSTVWTETSGHLGSVIKAILLDREARGSTALLDPHGGRLKDPMLRTTTLLRAFDGGKGLGTAPTDYPGLQWWDPMPLDKLIQEPMRAPSVFNFFEAVYQRPGEIADRNLRSPEFQILNDVTAATVPNYLWEGISEGFHHRNSRRPEKPLRLELSTEKKLADNNLEGLLDRCNLLITAGTMRAETRAQLLAHLKNVEDPAERARLAVFGTAVSAEGAILR